MMTKDNPFACGVSHAGISDHTSYWGEGYWGYSYSETSAANSYPWTRKDLFVDRSPLFNADKIKKPILFTHGTADTNVPVGESIQMYTALRLLGVPTAFIEVGLLRRILLRSSHNHEKEKIMESWILQNAQSGLIPFSHGSRNILKETTLGGMQYIRRRNYNTKNG